MKKSISKKLNRLLATSLILLSFFMIVFNLLIIYRTTLRNSEIMMSKTCSSQAALLNNQFKLVEQSVENLYEISESFRPDIKKLNDEKVSKEYVDTLREMAITVAENTDGAVAIYYRMNPDLSGSGTTGFFLVKSMKTGKFQENEITDLYAYDVDDIEHVGWYYIPVWTGHPVWMEPYYNANINLEMISYVIPVYEGNSLVGVVGIDIDFHQIKTIAEDIDIYKSNGAVLCSLSNSSVYYNKSTLFGNSIPNEIYKILQSRDCSNGVLTYEFNKKKYDYYFETLDNRMKFLIYAKADEIFSQGRYTIYISLAIFLVVLTATYLLSLRTGRRIVKPITEIMEVTKRYADGDWDAQVHCDTGDELQLLSENISVMAEKTKEYINYIKDMARVDALTGIRNKTGYMKYVEKINEEYIDIRKPFAVVVFDVNNLKEVNDNLGHEKGDELIVSASKQICTAFSHSPVFRIGGDEFAAIVDGADFESVHEIVGEFQRKMFMEKDNTDIMTVKVACGMALFTEDGFSYEVVFETADQRMYENKTMLKNGAAPR